jgi:hypothetical protein
VVVVVQAPHEVSLLVELVFVVEGVVVLFEVVQFCHSVVEDGVVVVFEVVVDGVVVVLDVVQFSHSVVEDDVAVVFEDVVDGVVVVVDVVQFSHSVVEEGVVVVFKVVVVVIVAGVVVVDDVPLPQTSQAVLLSLRGRTPAIAPLAAARAIKAYLTMMIERWIDCYDREIINNEATEVSLKRVRE